MTFMWGLTLILFVFTAMIAILSGPVWLLLAGVLFTLLSLTGATAR